MISQRIKAFFRQDEGATAIEFALVVMPFLLMLFGVIEISRMVWTMNSVEYAITETCRHAAINPDLSGQELEAYAQTQLDDMHVPEQKLSISSRIYTAHDVDFIELEADYEISSVLTGFLPFTAFNFETSVRRPTLE